MPVNVTNGVVNFLRRIKTGDYEHKEASVTLNFNIPEDMGIAEAAGHIERIGQMAETKAHVMLGLVKAGATHALAVVEKAVEPVTDRVDEIVNKIMTDASAVADEAANSETAKRLEAELTKPRRNRPPKVDPKPDPASVVEEPAQPAVTSPADDDPFAEDGDVFSAAEPEVTASDMISAVTKKNGEIRNPTAIKTLIGQFVAPPKTVRDIPQVRRREFLDKLAALTAAAA